MSLDTKAVLAVLRNFSHFGAQDATTTTTTAGPEYEATAALRIKDFYNSKQPLCMLLSAFPWKNPNPEQTLSSHPDFAEELALARLNHLCEELVRVYPYGAQVTLVPNGLVCNDLLAIPDGEFYDYGADLRQIAAREGFSHIKIIRLLDVLGLGDSACVSKAAYMSMTELCRGELEGRFLGAAYDGDDQGYSNRDNKLAHQAYAKSARDDLRWGRALDPEIMADPKAYENETQRVAERMTDRLLAYERALNAKFSSYIQLSLHEATGKTKYSIPLIPQSQGYPLTPWRSCVLVTTSGEYLTRNSKDLKEKPDQYEIIQKDGAPYFVREKHVDFEWPDHVQLYHKYGGRALLVNTSKKNDKLTMSDAMKTKLESLKKRLGTVELIGFS